MKRKVSFILIFFLTSIGSIAQSQSESPYKEYIKRSIYLSLKIVDSPKIQRQWTAQNVEILATVLDAIETHMDLSHKKMLSTILTESEMNIYALGGPNRNGSYDYGLTQQTSTYLWARYAAAKKKLKALGIPYTNSKFDIAVNVMAGAIVLKEFRSELVHRGVTNPYAHFVAYNVGPGGYFMSRMYYKKTAYLRRFKSFFVRL